MKKRLIALFVGLIAMVSANFSVVSAEDISNGAAFTPMSDVEQIEIAERYYTPEQVAQIKRKLALKGVKLSLARRASDITIEMAHFYQETSYWCGPATGKQTLHYINGTSPTQASLADTMRTTNYTTSGNFIYALNRLQSRAGYAQLTVSNQDEMLNAIYYDLALDNIPFVAVIQVEHITADLGYKPTSKFTHFLNVAGIRNNCQEVLLVDPGHTSSNPYHKVWVEVKTLYTGVDEAYDMVIC